MRKLLLSLLLLPGFLVAQNRPNILWITAEDMSPTLGCYGDDYAITPNIDRLASEGVRYTHAFATAPVCSPARSTLITGVYATSMGTQRLRSMFPIPDYVRGFPNFLKKAGYYTTNNVKTDYNCEQHARLIEESWHESSETAHWRGKKEGQPFFHVFNDMTSHQSRTMVWDYDQFHSEVQNKLSPEKIHDPDEAPIPPYYPDTEIVRDTVARFYDCVSKMDDHVGQLLDQLEEDGLAENTIVFFYSDHGSGMPRHKRNLHDSGMHVPLIIRFSEKWKHLAPADPGETIDRLVSFVDFPPTVLSLLGMEIPDYMQGTPFLGEQAGEPREYIYGARDRVDEANDVARSVRDKKWLYIRNFMPHLPWHQPCAWPNQGEIRQNINELIEAGKMDSPAQADYVRAPRPVEELYDTENDPLCLTNLADDPQYANVLKLLRQEQKRWSRETRDKGFLPESEAAKLAEEQPLLELPESYPLDNVRETAEQVGIKDAEEAAQILKEDLAPERYWGAMALHAMGDEAAPAKDQLLAALEDESAAVRIESAAVLAKLGEVERALEVLTEELAGEDLIAALHACRTIELMGPEKAKSAIPAMKAASERAKEGMGDVVNPLIPGETDKYMFLGFSADAFLAEAES